MNKTVTGTIQTIAVNNLDYAQVERERFDASDAYEGFKYLIVRPIHPDVNDVGVGTVFSDFRERVYDCFGSLLREHKYGFAKVIEHKRDGEKQTLTILLKVSW